MQEISLRALTAENTLREYEFRRMKIWAGGLLVLVTVLAGIAKWAHWEYVLAFAEAAMVGALADWFAVSALFRHPLGVPIPHTAIIPNNKARIAQGLSEFVVTHFLNEATVRQKLQHYDAARHLAAWLAQDEHRQQVLHYLRLAVQRGVVALDDAALRVALLEVTRSKLQQVDVSSLLVSGLGWITAQKGHRSILHNGLHRLADYLEHPDNQETVTQFIKSWSDNAFIQSMIEPFVPSIRTAVVNKLREVANDDEHTLYTEFDLQVQHYLERLQHDAALREHLNQQKNAWLNQPVFADTLNTLWTELHQWLVLDLARPDSRLHDKLEQGVQQLEIALGEAGALRTWLNEHLQRILLNSVQNQKLRLGEWMQSEVMRWDNAYLVNHLELYLGKDLQYIRINGTLVGGGVGVLLYAIGQWLG